MGMDVVLPNTYSGYYFDLICDSLGLACDAVASFSLYGRVVLSGLGVDKEVFIIIAL
jgi:hypothetical protein